MSVYVAIFIVLSVFSSDFALAGGTRSVRACSLFFSIAAQFHSKSDGVRRREGSYVFGDGRVAWVPRDGDTVVARGYYTGSASHREILRRQIGDARFNAIMNSSNPEALARTAVTEIEETHNKVATPEVLNAHIEKVAASIRAVPLDEPISDSLMDEALSLFERLGLYGDSLQEYVSDNRSKFEPELGQSTVHLNAMKVTVIGGSVELWRRSDDSSVRMEQLESIMLVEKSYLDLGNPGQAPQRPVGSVLWLPFHMSFVKFAQRIFGEDRLLYVKGESPEGGAGEYTQYWTDTRTGRKRGVQHTPLTIELFADGSYRLVEKNSRDKSVETGRWKPKKK